MDPIKHDRISRRNKAGILAQSREPNTQKKQGAAWTPERTIGFLRKFMVGFCHAPGRQTLKKKVTAWRPENTTKFI